MNIKNLGRIKIYLALFFAIVLSIVGFYAGKRVVRSYYYQTSSLAYVNEKSASGLWQPIFTWPRVNLAVAYEFELLADDKDISPRLASIHALYTTKNVYTNALNINMEPYKNQKKLYWRTRALDIDKQPISDFTIPIDIDMTTETETHDYPEPTSHLGKGQGGTLLYPVYSWVPLWGAAKYEVEVLSKLPENPQGILPSRYRIWCQETTLSDLYDEEPRIGRKAFYWRVRAMDENGNPIGTYSPAQRFKTNPAKSWEIGVFGDSISHGGGDMSYSPSDVSYSWLYYLNKPAVNLSRSGDTIETMVKRFDRDVLPFSPKYLLIMDGTNSLRAGAFAEEVIRDLIKIREKCLANNIEPIFLTLLPINPENIEKCFQEPTYEGWLEEMDKVNEFIRTQHNIDVAYAMPFGTTMLPTNMGIDGLHTNADAKKLIADVINADWDNVLYTSEKSQSIWARLFNNSRARNI